MNAALQIPQPFEPLQARFEAMTPAWLPAVLQAEQAVYPHPWSEANFLDSLRSGYEAQLLMAASLEKPELLGYFVAMKGVDEVHLLNLAVAPACQRQGWARVMLDALGIWARGQGAQWKCGSAIRAPGRCTNAMGFGWWARAGATTRPARHRPKAKTPSS